MYIKTKPALIAFTVVTLAICCIHAQDREPGSGAKATEKSNESASNEKATDDKASTKKAENSDSPKPINGASETMDKTATMKRVTGIGGVFIKAKDPKNLRAWYKTHLGIDVQTWGGATFRWGDSADVPANAKNCLVRW